MGLEEKKNDFNPDLLDSLSQNRPRAGLSGPLLGRLSVVDAPTGTMRRLAGTMQLQLIDDLGVFIWNLGWCGRKYVLC